MNRLKALKTLRRIGGAKRDRTADLYTASVALSQLSYSPKSGANFKGYDAECQEVTQLSITIVVAQLF